jgi:hypothetical protein
MSEHGVGHVYILVSPNSEFVKIGGTDFPPLKRIREINSGSPYRELGPWTLADFRQFVDWRKVESHLHYAFRSLLVTEVSGQKKLFRVAPHAVSSKLNELNPDLIVKRPAIDRMFQDTEFSMYILRLFSFAGLLNWLYIQGAWTFVLFPSTSGGRYFTINIGRHEVAYSTLPQPARKSLIHAVVMGRLIYDFPEVRSWVRERGGNIADDCYASALPRSVSVSFVGPFEDSVSFLNLEGVRRALIAYWAEALIGLKERGASSLFARYHNWNAVAELRARLAATSSIGPSHGP